MSKFTFGEWEAFIEYRPSVMGLYMYLSKRAGDRITFLTAHGKMEVVAEREGLKDDGSYHFAYFEDETQLQAIADAISKRGIKDQNDHKNAGLLEATKKHLEDMRLVALHKYQEPKI